MLFLWFALRDLQWGDLFAVFQEVDLKALGLALLLVLLGLGLKIWRWERLLSQYEVQVSAARIVEAFLTGQSLNIILPFRGGEIGRMAMILAGQGNYAPHVAVTIFLEKAFDLVTLGILATWLAFYLPPGILRKLLPVAGVVFIVLVVFLFKGREWLSRLGAWLANLRIGKAQQMAKSILEFHFQSDFVRNRRGLMVTTLLTLLIWCVMWGTNIVLFPAFGISQNSIAGWLVLVLVYIGLLPAIMPGNIGPFYFFARLALQPFNVSAEKAVAFSIVLHALVTIPPLVGGGISMILSQMDEWRHGRSSYGLDKS